MTDEQNLAPEASEEVVQTEAEQVTAPEAVESTQGQDESQPAEDDAEGQSDAETEETKSKSAERRERRKQEMERLRTSEAEAVKVAQEAKQALERAREAAKNLPKPKQADYETYDDYAAALSAYSYASMLDSRELQRLEASAQAHFEQINTIKQQKQQEDAQHWAAQVADAKAKYADFEQVALYDAPITQPMAEVIVGSDVAAEISYFLGKNPSIANSIAGLNPVEMGRAIGRLEAQVTAPKPKTATDAPQPITPVRGKATASKDPAQMTMAEYQAARKAGKI